MAFWCGEDEGIGALHGYKQSVSVVQEHIKYKSILMMNTYSNASFICFYLFLAAFLKYESMSAFIKSDSSLISITFC